LTRVYGGGGTQISEKVRQELGLRDDYYVVWFNDRTGKMVHREGQGLESRL